MRHFRLGLMAIGLAAVVVGLDPGASAQQKQQAEKSNMELVGYNDLQGRSAYQPRRAQAGRPLDRLRRPSRRLDGQTAHRENRKPTARRSSTSPIREAAEIPRAHSWRARARPSRAARRWCACATAATLPRADRSKVYLLRTFGNTGARNLGRHRSVEARRALTVVVSGLRGHAQELVGVRHRHRVSRHRRARLAHAAA